MGSRHSQNHFTYYRHKQLPIAKIEKSETVIKYNKPIDKGSSIITMMDECNHYTHNNQNFYPVIHIDEIEECSNLGSTIDEEAVVEGSVTVAGNGYGNESGGSEDDLNTTRNGLSFNNLSRRINSSGPMKKFFFVGTVFIVLSCVGLSAVGVEKLLRNSGHFAKDSIGREEVASAEEQVERSSDDDLVGKFVIEVALSYFVKYQKHNAVYFHHYYNRSYSRNGKSDIIYFLFHRLRESSYRCFH